MYGNGLRRGRTSVPHARRRPKGLTRRVACVFMLKQNNTPIIYPTPMAGVTAHDEDPGQAWRAVAGSLATATSSTVNWFGTVTNALVQPFLVPGPEARPQTTSPTSHANNESTISLESRIAAVGEAVVPWLLIKDIHSVILKDLH